MSQVRNAFIAEFAATNAFSMNGKLTNFSCDSLNFAISGASAVTLADLAEMIVRVQLKNSKGSNAIIINSVPLSLLAKYSDSIQGWGVNSEDKYGAISIPVGNIVLEGDDELDITISGSGLSQAYTVSVFGYDYKTGAERILLYDYVDASATQVYQQVDALAVYVSIAEGTVPSDTSSIAVNDYFGRNIITEGEAIALGTAMSQSGDWDNFGLVWSDDTGLSQDMSFKASTDDEEFLVIRQFFDVNRIGMGQQSVIDFADYLSFIKRTNPTKYKCLQYVAKLNKTI